MKLDNIQYKKYLLKHQKFQITSISKFQIFVGAGRGGKRRGEEREGGVRAREGKGGGGGGGGGVEACFIWARGLSHGP